MLVILCFFIIYINKSQGDCVIDNRSEENDLELKLHKDLKSGYFIPDSPKPNCTVNVYLRFQLRSYNFQSDEEYFIVNSEVAMSWYDDRLMWNATEYDGIRTTVVMSYNLWLPGLRLINMALGDDYDKYFFSPCQLRSDGKILCFLRTKYEAQCNTKLTHWPYDIQTCSLEFGAWPRERTKVVFQFSKTDELVSSTKGGGQWYIVDSSHKSDPNSEVQLKIIVTLQRQATSLAAIIVYPFLIFPILNIALVALDIRRTERLGMLFFSLASHFLFLSELNSSIPKRGSDAPIILLYYRGSLIITLTLIIYTYILRLICYRVKPNVPLFTINNKVMKGPLKYFILLRWNCSDEKDSKEVIIFASIVNSFCILIIMVVYVYLILAFIPTESRGR